MAFSNLAVSSEASNTGTTVHAFPTSPNAGDVIIVAVGRGNASAAGSPVFDHAEAAGYTEVAHQDPTLSFTGIITVLAKIADGTETNVTVLSNNPTGAEIADSDTGITIGSAFANGDINSIVATIAEQASNTTAWSWPAETLDGGFRFYTSNQPADLSPNAFPAGDAQQIHLDTTTIYRVAGVSDAGPGTTGGTFAQGTSGMVVTVSLAEITGGPVVTITSPLAGETVEPNAPFSVSTNTTATGEQIDATEYELQRASDGFYWVTNAWQAPAGQNLATFPPQNSPNSFLIGATPDLDESETYTLRVRSRGTVNGFGDYTTVVFDTCTWEAGVTTTATMDANAPTPDAVDDNFTSTVGVAANHDFGANDDEGAGGASYSLVSGTVPPGMGISSTGQLSGTPSTAGTYSFVYQIEDVNGATDTATVQIVVGAAAPVPDAVNDIFTSTVGVAANHDFGANDNEGAGGAIYSLVSGTVPTGMTANSSGVLTGTPTTAGTFSFVYRLEDANGATDDATVQVTVGAPTGVPIAISDSFNAANGAAVSFNAAANDTLGDAPNTFAIISGALPAGLTMNANGLISGTPADTAGAYAVTYQITDNDGDTDTATVNITLTDAAAVDGPALFDDLDQTAQVGVAYSFDVTANDVLGVSPTIVSYDSGNVPPGLAFAGGMLTGTPTIAGTYQFVYSATDANGQTDTATATIVVAEADGPAPGECCEIALTFLTLEADGPATSCCDPRPLIVDANGGTAYDNGFDAAGNPAVVVPGFGVAKDAVTYVSGDDQVPPAECCLTNEDIGRPAYDYTQNCVTHICMGPSLGWRAICGNDGGGTVEPPPDADIERVCYSTTGILPGAYGGTGTGWLVSGLQQLDIACEGAVTGAPTFIGWTVDFDGDAAGGFYPLPVAQLAYPLTDTGQTAEVNGGILPGNGVSGGMFGVEFGASSGEGPITFSFTRPQIAQNGPSVNAWVFNTATGTIEQIASSTGGGSIQNNPSFPGDHLNTTATGTYGFTLVNQSADPADLILYFSAVNDSPTNEQGQPLFNSDVITNIEVSYVAEGDCCNTLNTAADIAALFTANDPIGNTWTIIGSTVCSDMPIGQGASYGVLQLCDVGPVTPTIGFP